MSKENEIPRSVAIVGRPNVGKSRLFNRLVGRRISIVHDMPGVTRDLINEQVRDGDYLLMDTGGLGLFSEDSTPKVIAEAVEEQVLFAIQAAELVVLVTDVSQGCTPLDLEVAELLRHHDKQVILVVNKVDNDDRKMSQADFFNLGFGTPIMISAEHNLGIDFLRAEILKRIGEAPATEGEEAPSADAIKICLAGRPNVGKSSLGNALLKEARLIVSEVAGTTRDPIKSRLNYTTKAGKEVCFELIDTAGRRARNKFDTLEYFSALRSDEALQSADVCFLIIDATTGVTKLDKQLAGQLIELGTGLIVVVNKWDLARARFRTGAALGEYETEDDFRRAFAIAVNKELFFLPTSKILFTSAKDGYRIETMLDEAVALYERMNVQLPTAQINRLIHDTMDAHPPRMISGRRFKCYYAVQTGNKPLRLRLFCNSEEKIEDSYVRFLLSKFYSEFDLGGVPIKFDFIGKPKQERTFFAPQQTETVGGISTAITRSNAKLTLRPKAHSPSSASADGRFSLSHSARRGPLAVRREAHQIGEPKGKGKGKPRRTIRKGKGHTSLPSRVARKGG